MTAKASVGTVDNPPPGHYFDTTPTAASARRTVMLALPDLSAELITDRAVFSGDHIDSGTRYLLLDAPVPAPDATTLLDLGCGYGPIAVTLARRAPNARVLAVDVNERAVELTRLNAAALHLTHIEASLPHEVPDDVVLDALWSNPPIRIGKPALHELLEQWLPRLRAGGHAYLVVQKHLGADSLQRWLTDNGWPTNRIGSRAGYRLLDVTTQPSA
jgi:16S rRNA (guanine1207-N2)-methyltransferase